MLEEAHMEIWNMGLEKGPAHRAKQWDKVATWGFVEYRAEKLEAVRRMVAPPPPTPTFKECCTHHHPEVPRYLLVLGIRCWPRRGRR